MVMAKDSSPYSAAERPDVMTLMPKQERLYQLFRIPTFFNSPELLLRDDDREFILAHEGNPVREGDIPQDRLSDLYRRAVLNKEIDAAGRAYYVIGDFYHFISSLILTDPDRLRQLPDSAREALKGWYFHHYYDWLVENGAAKGCLKEDRVLTLAETLEFLTETSQTIYLADCECRLFYDNCSRPIRTCLCIGSAPNTPGDRGTAQPISRDKAMEVVKRADREGLMHTLSGMGICCCCGDCCCMFHSQKKMGSFGVWPVASHQIHMDKSKCIKCKTCLTRCHMDVFSLDTSDGSIRTDVCRCAGCGLCVNTCPTGALSLIHRGFPSSSDQ